MIFSQDKITKLFLVDDHQVLRESLKYLLSQEEDLQIIGCADDGLDLEAKLAEDVPDVVLMDLSMPRRDGFETTKALKKQFPGIKIIVLTMHKSENTVARAFRCGCNGYVLKNNALEELIDAIRKVMDGDVFVSDELTPMLVNGFLVAEDMTSELSGREYEIMKLLAEGYNNKEISDMLSISVRTVETHRSSIMRKHNFKNITELVLYAVRNNIIEV